MEQYTKINRADIIVGDRLRKDYGNIGDLADSIEQLGLIHPLVLSTRSDGRFDLVAGGRRLSACDELNITTFAHGTTSTPGTAGFVFASELPDDVRRELELEENVRRQSMSWQERTIAIADIHDLKSRKAAINRQRWGLKETGDLIGQDFSSVSYAITVAERLRAGDEEICNCTGIREALDVLVQRREDIAQAELAKMSVPKAGAPNAPTIATPVITEKAPNGEDLVVPLSTMLRNIKCVTGMKELGPESVDHIISDWPYAIDMDNLSQSAGMDVSRVADTHDVDSNLLDYPGWLVAMYAVLRPGGFCILWYDNVHFHLIRDWAEGYGFRVQRWPLVWIKTHACLNQSAHKNFTKRTEFAIVLSKGNATIPQPVGSNYWAGGRDAHTSNPFAKPLGLWTWIYESVCLKGQTVLDPFMGEGSATVAAVRYGLRPLGFEIDSKHFNAALNNIRQTYTELTKGKVKFV